MITQEIAFHAPRSLSEVLELVERYGGEAKVLGGGMSLVPAMNLGVARPTTLISLNHVAELVGITDDAEWIRIGGATPHVDVLGSAEIRRDAPALAEAAGEIGDVQVRNRGTIGGSVAHADPAANYLPTLVALGAEIVVHGPRGQRTASARDFFVDILQTDLEPDEVVVAVRVPRAAAGTGSAYRQLSRIEGSFPLVSAAAVVGPDGTRVAIGGVAGRPVVVDDPRILPGRPDDAALDRLAGAVREACVDALSDLHADAAYRREMAGVHARRAVVAAAAAASGASGASGAGGTTHGA